MRSGRSDIFRIVLHKLFLRRTSLRIAAAASFICSSCACLLLLQLLLLLLLLQLLTDACKGSSLTALRQPQHLVHNRDGLADNRVWGGFELRLQRAEDLPIIGGDGVFLR